MARSAAGRYRDALRHRDFTLMLTAALLIVGLGFSVVAVAGLWPLARVRVVPAVPASRAPLPA